LHTKLGKNFLAKNATIRKNHISGRLGDEEQGIRSIPTAQSRAQNHGPRLKAATLTQEELIESRDVP